MKRVVGPAGYTIVETMIFLAVSGLLFISASVLITGRQRRTQFTTTVRDFSSKLESVYGNVASGYYNGTGKVTCEVSGGKISKLTGDGNQQGTNSDCIYLGQVVVSPPVNGNNFQIISLVGLRRTSSPAKEVENLTEANPRLYTETAETYTLAGADFVSVKADSSPITSPNGSSVGFISSFASYNAQNLLKTGSANTNVYPIASGDTSGGQIESTLLTAPSNPKNIEYCLSNGEQKARVTLVGGTTSYVIGDNTLCY